MALNASHGKAPSIAFAAGLLAVYLGERILMPGHAASTATVLGLVAIAVAIGLGIGQGKGRPAGMILPALYGVGLLALLLYFCRATLPALLGRRPLETSMPRLDGVLGALWPAVLLAGALSVLLVELSYASMARAPLVDARRLRRALGAGLGIAFALVFCFAVSYVASERNHKADLSFFRTARASAATKQLVQALDKPVEVTLFYPPGNEVAEELAGYFSELARAGGQLTVTRVDHAVDPARGKALGVNANGAVSIARGTQHEQIPIPLKLEAARGRLRSLDQDVYKRLLMVSRGRRTIYLVQGHGERAFTTPRDGDANASLGHLKDLLTLQNLDTRELGLAQGLGNEVPADAALVMVVGPQQAMLPEETAALLRYFRGGGRLLVAVDPDAATAAAPLLAGLSLELSPTVLANDRVYWARTHQKSDRTDIAATSYSPHAALATLSQFGAQLPVVFVGAGSLAKSKVAPSPAPVVDFVVRTDGNTFEDKNGDFEPDKDEPRKPYAVGAALTLRPTPAKPGDKPDGANDKQDAKTGDKPATKPDAGATDKAAAKGEDRLAKPAAAPEEARAFVIGDADPFTDLLIANRANAIFAVDVLRWLLGEPEVAGPPNNEEDVPVRHTRKQDVVWFYASIFLAPALVLGVGFLATRKPRKREVTS